MLRKKNIVLNGIKANGNEILQDGDKVKLFLAEETIEKFSKEKPISATPSPKINIAYEDENIILAIKPKGQLSHPDSGEKTSLIYDILAYLQAKGEIDQKLFTPALANRLDRNTTGLVLCGKNLPALQALNYAISRKLLHKYYVAIVCGQIKKSGTLIGYHTKDSTKNTVKITQKEPGEEVITKYSPIETYKDFTYVKLQLVTGKSHQLRAHMNFMGHPILGDTKYGDKNHRLAKKFGLKSQLLHACNIYFDDNITELKYLQGKTFTAPLPKEFSTILKSMR